VPQFTDDLVRGLGMSARNNALAYGYSVTETGSFAVLTKTAGPTSIGHVFGFVVGASLAFAGVNALVTRGFRSRVEREPPVVVALATSLSIISISAGVGVAILFAAVVGGWWAWMLGALMSTCTYLAIGALEMAVARALHLNIGDTDPAER
jgi:hypothetical protein